MTCDRLRPAMVCPCVTSVLMNAWETPNHRSASLRGTNVFSASVNDFAMGHAALLHP